MKLSICAYAFVKQELGCKMLQVGSSDDPDSSSDFEIIAKDLRRLADLAAQQDPPIQMSVNLCIHCLSTLTYNGSVRTRCGLGVRMCTYHLSGFQIARQRLRCRNTWEHTWEICKRVDRPNLGLCLDTFQICGTCSTRPCFYPHADI